ncbi:MAG: hypothetical protein Q9M92_11580 [Enterobacterales bacterium]|nr:hypothetical protein [Enterobacterales bacterium]
MQSSLYYIALYTHIIIGAVALVAFWLPLLAKKGSVLHKKSGRWFVNAMYTVAISGFIMTSLVLLDPIAVRYADALPPADKIESIIRQQRIFAGFLLMLSWLVFTNVRQSLLVLEAKSDRSILRKPAHVLTVFSLGCLGVIMLTIGMQQQIMLFKIFSVLCIVISFGSLHYIFKRKLKSREWIMAHMGNIIGAGIGTYTAFFAFGGKALFSEILTGGWQILPWILPSLIGIAYNVYSNKGYRQQFKVGS